MIPINKKTEMKLLYQKFNFRIIDIVKMFPIYPRSSIYKVCKQSFNHIDKRVNSKRPRVISQRSSRRIVSALAELRGEMGNGGFSAQDILQRSGVQASRRTVARHLNALGYRVRQLRKKGILSKEDRKKRLNFARRERNRNVSFFKDDIFLYFDGINVAYKKNAMLAAQRMGNCGYRKLQEATSITSAGAKEGTGGKTAHFYVGISTEHGVSLCINKGTDNSTGDSFATMVKTDFPNVKDKVNKGSTLLMDGCPVQNSKKAKMLLLR